MSIWTLARASSPCPVGYDAYLTQLYGNYMRIPKEGERAAHSFRAYWRDEA